MEKLLYESMINYYGVDWLAMFSTFISLYLLGKKNRYGFIFGLVANISWMTFGIMAQSVANVVANILFTGLNIKGYYNWGRQKVDI